MKIKKFNNLNEDISRKEANNLGIKKHDLVGGITIKEYREIIDFIENLKKKAIANTITDEEKVLSEIFLQLINIKNLNEDNLNYNIYFHRRLSFIKNNKDKKITK